MKVYWCNRHRLSRPQRHQHPAQRVVSPYASVIGGLSDRAHAGRPAERSDGAVGGHCVARSRRNWYAVSLAALPPLPLVFISRFALHHRQSCWFEAQHCRQQFFSHPQVCVRTEGAARVLVPTARSGRSAQGPILLRWVCVFVFVSFSSEVRANFLSFLCVPGTRTLLRS